jgi:Tfp pilus assembly protein PilN
MIFDKLIPKKYQIRQEVCALEALHTESGIVYHYTLLKNKGKKLEVISSGTIRDKIELPRKILKGKIPISVIVNGKGVIIKKIDLPHESLPSPVDIVSQNLPGVNKEDLFIQVYNQQNSTAFITLCRKELVNNCMDELSKQKYEIAAVHIGVPAIAGLKPVWDSFNRVYTSVHDVELNNSCIESIVASGNNNSVVSVGGLELTKEHVLGFSIGLTYLLQNTTAENIDPQLGLIEIKHVERNKFKVLTLACVAIAFVVAVANMLFYTSYFDQSNKLETELSVYQGKYDQINTLLNEYQNKKELIEGAGILTRSKLSEYADRIGATIPEEVVLSQMYFNPKNEDVESEDSLVTFYNNQMVIKGNCNKSLVVNEWLNVLKMQKFIKDVSLEKFTYNTEGMLPNFEIKILIN